METKNFEKLVQSITGRELIIDTQDSEIIGGKEYRIYKVLPITQGTVSFKWKAALTDEKMLRSFITAFTTKYKEPDPKCYNKVYGGVTYTWDAKTEKEKEYAYYNHSSNMFYKDELMKQIENNFENENMQSILMRYGFYSTEYGVGIFALFTTNSIVNSIKAMGSYLTEKSIPFTNEYSDARWVYRFKLNISKEIHSKLIQQFNK